MRILSTLDPEQLLARQVLRQSDAFDALHWFRRLRSHDEATAASSAPQASTKSAISSMLAGFFSAPAPAAAPELSRELVPQLQARYIHSLPSVNHSCTWAVSNHTRICSDAEGCCRC